MEAVIQQSYEPTPASDTACEERCILLAKKIEEYLTVVGNIYDNNPEQKSIMLLTVMELWMSMEQCAIKLYGILQDYNPVFPANILDVLQLQRLKDMERMQSIRSYLRERLSKCGYLTIFNDPIRGCFGERYFQESTDSSKLEELRRKIEAKADNERQQKEQEWRSRKVQYEQVVLRLAESSHILQGDESRPNTWSTYERRCDRSCPKCRLQRTVDRFTISTLEYLLPSDDLHTKVVVFEMACPKAFAAYRQATWRILATLSVPSLPENPPPVHLLRETSQLAQFMDESRYSFTLGSQKKAFPRTHYERYLFPVDLEDLLYPCGLRFKYFDTRFKVWPGRQKLEPTFVHHCKLIIPQGSPFSMLLSSSEFKIDSTGPSSYSIIASQTKCPPGVNVHEFIAFQALFSGNYRRWPQILMELGASNLNFSTETTALLLFHLALQVGPCDERLNNALGSAHEIFSDTAFCTKLSSLLGQRLDGVSSNWRETNCMEALITMIQRLVSLGTGITEEYMALLEKARTVTFQWITVLRGEVEAATDADTSRTLSRYVLWASLLCRRTFSPYLDDPRELGAVALKYYIESSIAMQDNMVADPTTLPILLRFSLDRDLKMVYNMRFLLRRSLHANQHSMISSIASIWPAFQGISSKNSSHFRFLEDADEWWAEVIVEATTLTKQQTVHFHLLEGHLLVDKEPIGRLPANYMTNETLTQLFGSQNLLAYPSNLPGMTYTLAVLRDGHQVHLGFRNKNVVVRALYDNTVLEHIPGRVFGSSEDFDLPASLMYNCVHWLNISTGIIEIRQEPHIWKRKSSNWILDYHKRRAMRRTVTLVDPHSPLFKRVASLFRYFEYSHHLTVYQPEKKNLSVELKRLALSFTVNSRHYLESAQLRAEMDFDQDAGTWYGFVSKIVLRDIGYGSVRRRQRSIIVPMGDLAYRRYGVHVKTWTENVGHYGRYTINTVLGRLDCPAEPRLLYFKAQCHAYTSFIQPDPLTGRTGTEEALHCLRSGCFQPWKPLEDTHFGLLTSIARLTPLREYYPENLKVMQKTQWNPQLTTTMQHDGLRVAVESILEKSNQLSTFASQDLEPYTLEPGGDTHLTRRSHLRRQIYRRSSEAHEASEEPKCVVYDARDRWRASQGRSNIVECVNLILKWPSKIGTTTDLAGILKGWPEIGGFIGNFEKILLSDLLGLEIASEWGSLVKLCCNSSADDSYQLMFLFSAMSFRQDVDMRIVRSLIAFAVLEELKAIPSPAWPLYKSFSDNEVPRADDLRQLMRPFLLPYEGDEISNLELNFSAKQRKKFDAMQRAYEQQQEMDSKVLAEFLLDQWPCPEPTIEGFTVPVLLDVEQAMETIRPEWLRLLQNLELSQYVSQVQVVLDRHHTSPINLPNSEVQEQKVLASRYRGGECPTLSELLGNKGPDVQPTDVLNFRVPQMASGNTNLSQDLRKIRNKSRPGPAALSAPSSGSKRAYPSSPNEQLKIITNCITDSDSAVWQQYGKDLAQSLKALINLHVSSKKYDLLNSEAIARDILVAETQVKQHLTRLASSFELGESRSRWLRKGGLWPAITPVALLEYLRSSISPAIFGTNMKECLVYYGLSITNLQRILRMEDALQKGHTQRLIEERENSPHSNWKPLECSDWLLLEIDSNILIRPGQVDVALATISPASGANSVLQMNMGQGKTSCIIPMAAAILANGKNLLRVVMPKALLPQTAPLLHARLGGLLGREVCHIPFSRKTPTDAKTIDLFHAIHRSIQKSSGIMLSLPDHILSFKLSGLQALSDGRIQEAKKMITIQSWLSRVSRDVVDEADHILAIRIQLIYPSGSQKTVDGHPHRWQTIEMLLKMVEAHLWNLKKGFPQSIEVVRGEHGRFPVVFFLRKDAEDALISRVIDEIYRGRTALFPEDLKKSERLAIKRYISEPKVSSEVVKQINNLYPEKPAVKQVVNLLRGLLVHRILLMTLKKRWNVQYGLHPTRDPIAVPFHAKGTPSEQAEWGHPDVAILFTCLAFYHGGLNVAQLSQALEHVLKSDDPSQTYDTFSDNSNLPDSLRDWSAINLDDEAQIFEIWTHVRYHPVVIDYFMNNFVFPRHAKQFQLKLQASGWDIPLFSMQGAPVGIENTQKVGPRLALTTGFSGTNDWKRMFPLTIKQQDLQGLAHTNAEVLTYLLQERSRQYVVAADYLGRRLSEEDLLKRISKMNIRVLIDAGAQILEMDNMTLAKVWLDIAHDAPAVVYFRDNRPFILYRQGRQVPLLASPFADDLGECLVYLDEAHTRGTDLKMPAMACGALTLGLGQTKDHTVQAAMRLRQLGTTQSVVFFAPPEVHQSILDVRNKNKTVSGPLSSYDVVHWLLEQTCAGIEQLQPLYFSQGADFCRRAQAALNNPDFLLDEDHREKYLLHLRQYEQQSLQALYGVGTKTKQKPNGPSSNCRELDDFTKELNKQRKAFQDTGSAVHGSALQEVEQEREVAHEVENVREVQKPVHFEPVKFSRLHPDISSFVRTGRLAADSSAFEHAFHFLRRTYIGRKYSIGTEGTTQKLYVSTEFARTIKVVTDRSFDNFQRHPNWILWSSVTETAMIVNPEEVECLIPLLQSAKKSSTHLLTYCAPVTRKMLQFNDLKFYAIPTLPIDWEAPAWLKVELGLFAGRLYFDFSEYELLCQYLGVKESSASLEEEDEEDLELNPLAIDGIVEEAPRKELKLFARKPLTFMHEWLALRRKGQDFASTPMGHVCQGKPLRSDHPFFRKPETREADTTQIRRVGAPKGIEEDEDVDEEFFDCDDEAYGHVGIDEVDTFDDAELEEESSESEED